MMSDNNIEKETRESIDQDLEVFASEDSGLIAESLHRGQREFKCLPSGRLLIEAIMLLLILVLSGLLISDLTAFRPGLAGFGPSCKLL